MFFERINRIASGGSRPMGRTAKGAAAIALAVAAAVPVISFSNRSSAATLNGLQKIVLEGALLGEGMPSFKQSLRPTDVDAIRAFIIGQRRSAAPARFVRAGVD